MTFLKALYLHGRANAFYISYQFIKILPCFSNFPLCIFLFFLPTTIFELFQFMAQRRGSCSWPLALLPPTHGRLYSKVMDPDQSCILHLIKEQTLLFLQCSYVQIWAHHFPWYTNSLSSLPLFLIRDNEGGGRAWLINSCILLQRRKLRWVWFHERKERKWSRGIDFF